MAHVVIFTRRDRGVLPSLELLEHRVSTLPATAEAVAHAPAGDLLIVDGVLPGRCGEHCRPFGQQQARGHPWRVPQPPYARVITRTVQR